MKRNDNMRRYLQALEPNAKSESGWHLSQDELLRLTQATENDESASPLREHLSHCPACVLEFKQLHAFHAPPTPREKLPDQSELARAWAAFTPHLPKTRPVPTVSATAPRASWWQDIFAPRLGWALAALLLLATGLCFWWALRLRNEKQVLADNFYQHRNEYIKTLNEAKRPVEKPIEQLTREVRVLVPARGKTFSFVIKAPDLPAAPNYRAELVNPAGRVIWHGPALRDQADTFRFTFPRLMVTSGDYLMRFYAAEETAIAAEYTVRMRG